ncbi:CBS domain-containing protein [Streptomyces sp. NPDC052701]|uniref:CBS domain-containing protein n=1 Tax=Streptomyces sp. NPDC052701 TaxID=3155533 RepID=UPI0034375185
MTLVQMQTRPASTRPVRSTAADAVDAAGPRVWDDMTVEVALSVMAAGTGHLVVCDEDGRCTGLVTQARLTTIRGSSGYTDRIRPRDITDGSGPFVSPLATRAEAQDAMPCGRPEAVPATDEHGNAPGVLAPSR